MKRIVLEASKETRNKLRWDVPVGDALFELYIPKWKVPKPWPSQIAVTVLEWPHSSRIASLIPQSIVDQFPEESVLTIVEFVEDCLHTTHFAPIGDPLSWEIGEPYFPAALLPNHDAKRLIIVVEWLTSQPGRFRREP